VPELECIKTLAGTLPPDRPVIDLMEHTAWFKRIPLYDTILWKFTHPRNYEFHKKWWALVNFAFEMWEPKSNQGKLFDTFRHEITIMAGHYEVVCSLGNYDVKKVPKSISWASMTEDEFPRFYDATKDVVWDHVFSLIDTHSREEFEKVALELSSF